jgi:hypothetical protein
MKAKKFSGSLSLTVLLLGLITSLQAQSWSFTGSMSEARVYPTATLLQNGQVLVAGRYHRGLIVGVAELYNPSTGTFTDTASMNTPRQGHASALLHSGEVLATGGYESQLGNYAGYLASAELFQP